MKSEGNNTLKYLFVIYIELIKFIKTIFAVLTNFVSLL